MHREHECLGTPRVGKLMAENGRECAIIAAMKNGGLIGITVDPFTIDRPDPDAAYDTDMK